MTLDIVYLLIIAVLAVAGIGCLIYAEIVEEDTAVSDNCTGSDCNGVLCDMQPPTVEVKDDVVEVTYPDTQEVVTHPVESVEESPKPEATPEVVDKAPVKKKPAKKAVKKKK